jgi:D-serine deaminase-like pyridoxal phosphate-dependent protein
MSAQTIDDLPTPALILDRAILNRNLKRMSDRLRDAGVMLRPHLKTAKSIEIGRRAVEGHDGRITVSTLAEARYFAEGGFTDILYGVGVVPSKLPAIAELRRQGINLRMVTDNLAVTQAVAAAATGRFWPQSGQSAGGETFSVLIEIDSGGGRAGLPYPELPGLLDIARVLHKAPGVELAGVMTHAGHSYHHNTPDGIAAVAEQERQAIVGAAEKLRANGIPCPIVSAGSTPTAMHSRDFTGITEMRPGVYVFNDLDQAFIGSCSAGDLALSVLASVIGHYPHRNQVLVDAGALALSKDISAQEFKPQVGYGTIVDAPAQDMAVIACSQEHGFVGANEPIPFGNLPVGSRVRILPNHACITAAAYDRYYVVDSELDGGKSVVDVYDRINGW